MREDRRIADPIQRALQPRYTPVIESFDIADVEVTIGGEVIRLGDLWAINRIQAQMSMRGDS